jgi:hypothetical protein
MPFDLAHVAACQEITDEEVIRAFATLMAAMRTRGIIRTKNVVGDLGERYAVHAYEAHGKKRPIALASTNSTDFDARDASGFRFNIKAVSHSSTRTSAFHLEKDREESEKAFDYLVVVRVNDLMQPVQVFEFTWEQFWRVKVWSERQKAWFLPLTKKVLNSAEVIFSTIGGKG